MCALQLLYGQVVALKTLTANTTCCRCRWAVQREERQLCAVRVNVLQRELQSAIQQLQTLKEQKETAGLVNHQRSTLTALTALLPFIFLHCFFLA